MPPLVDDLVEEVLLRLPPHEPANLVRAALVCRGWRHLVTDPGFSRRFREFHRSPPMLGMLCNRAHTQVARFVPTAAFCSPEAEADRSHYWRRALDARHGRVLLHGKKGGRDLLVVWDPITEEEQMLPFPPHHSNMSFWTATVLCATAAAGAGACDHLDCHRRPFVVVLVASVFHGGLGASHTSISTYTSKTAAWTEQIDTAPGSLIVSVGSTLVGNALYFLDFMGNRVLKYNLELHEMSWILLPPPLLHGHRQFVLIATGNSELGVAAKHGSRLSIWLRNQDDACKVGEEWKKPSRAINLKKLLPADAALSKLEVVGSMEGVSIIFVRAYDVVYAIDLKTYKVKKVYEGRINTIITYMSFYTPALEAACTSSEGPSVGGSSACKHKVC